MTGTSTSGDAAARRRVVLAAILLVGCTISAALYATTPPAVEDPDVHEVEHSRRYRRDLERIGGKAGLLARDVDEWVGSLWQGEHRAYTAAGVTALAATAYAYATRPGRGRRGPPAA